MKPNHYAKVIARVSLGLVWLYEGLVPKLLFLRAHPEQIDLVRRSGFYWHTPVVTLNLLGIAMAVAGIILITGWLERAAVLTATISMGVLIVLVAYGRPEMLTDPFGALPKDFCLMACAAVVWLLAPRAGANCLSYISKNCRGPGGTVSRCRAS